MAKIPDSSQPPDTPSLKDFEKRLQNGRFQLFSRLKSRPVFLILAGMILLGIGLAYSPEPTALTSDAQAYLSAAEKIIHPQSASPWHFIISQLFRAPTYIFLVVLPMMGLGFWNGQDGPIAHATVLSGIRAFQLLLWSGNLILTGLIAHRFYTETNISPKPHKIARATTLAVLSAFVCLLYWPLLFQTGRILTETSTSTCLLTSIYFYQRRKIIPAALFGFLALMHSFFTVWPKLAFMGILLLFPVASSLPLNFQSWLKRPVIPYSEIKQHFKKQKAWILWILVPLFLLQVASVIISHYQMTPVYFWQYIASNGWATLAREEQWVSNALYQGVVLPGPPFHPGVDWGRLLLQYGDNMTRLISLPDNPYRQSGLGIPPEILQGLHWFIMLGFLLGLPHFGQDKRTWLLWALPLVWVLTYAGTNIELRYLLPVMPFIIIGSCLGWQRWMTSILLSTDILQRGMVIAATIIAYTGIALLWGQQVSQSFWQGGMTTIFISTRFFQTSQVLNLALLTLFLVGLAYLYQKQYQSFSISIKSLGIITLPLLCYCLIDSQPVEQAMLVQQAIQQDIELGKNFYRTTDTNAKIPLETFLVVEAPLFGNQDPVTSKITINQHQVLSQPYTLPFILAKHPHLTGGRINSLSIRHYSFYLLPASLDRELVNKSKARISIAPLKGKPLWLYKDWPINKTGNYRLPNPDWRRYSLYKSLYQGDGREYITLKAPKREAFRYRLFLLRIPIVQTKQDIQPLAQYRDVGQGAFLRDFRLAY